MIRPLTVVDFRFGICAFGVGIRPARSPVVYLILVSLSIGTLGCQSTYTLMPVPNLFVNTDTNPFVSVPPNRRHNHAQVIYATDRERLSDRNGSERYGYTRSASLAVGIAEIEFGDEVPWDVLAQQSLAQRRTEQLGLRVLSFDERVRYPDRAEYLAAVVGDPDQQRKLAADVNERDAQVAALVASQLEGISRKEAYLFVHGYNVRFDDAVRTITQLWHFMGRDGVPIAYTWPAGHGGLRGYTVDRESGEYTVTHLKRFLLALAASPDLERIHIIAHSRGTDVALTALRELAIRYWGAQQDPRTALKLGNVILAAPDLDLDVVSQRVATEGVIAVPPRLTVYISKKDRALGAAAWLFESTVRLGRLPFDLLSPDQRSRFAAVPGLELVDARTRRMDLFGHSYFYQSPAVSSDLILVLRENRDPGAANGRPLTPVGENFWAIEENYPDFGTE